MEEWRVIPVAPKLAREPRNLHLMCARVCPRIWGIWGVAVYVCVRGKRGVAVVA